jgi:hypothetical protein
VIDQRGSVSSRRWLGLQGVVRALVDRTVSRCLRASGVGDASGERPVVILRDEVCEQPVLKEPSEAKPLKLEQISWLASLDQNGHPRRKRKDLDERSSGQASKIGGQDIDDPKRCPQPAVALLWGPDEIPYRILRNVGEPPRWILIGQQGHVAVVAYCKPQKADDKFECRRRPSTPDEQRKPSEDDEYHRGQAQDD